MSLWHATSMLLAVALPALLILSSVRGQAVSDECTAVQDANGIRQAIEQDNGQGMQLQLCLSGPLNRSDNLSMIYRALGGSSIFLCLTRINMRSTGVASCLRLRKSVAQLVPHKQ